MNTYERQGWNIAGTTPADVARADGDHTTPITDYQGAAEYFLMLERTGRMFHPEDDPGELGGVFDPEQIPDVRARLFEIYEHCGIETTNRPDPCGIAMAAEGWVDEIRHDCAHDSSGNWMYAERPASIGPGVDIYCMECNGLIRR